MKGLTVFFICFWYCLNSNAQNTPVKIQMQAPDISMQQPDGKLLQLKSFRGALVLVDFWATWCLPCVKEQPELKAIYQKNEAFVKRGKFQILGVSLDNKKENWTKGIQRQQITWPQVSDLKFWKSKAAHDYGMEEFPFNVVIDETGKIVAINIHGKQLEEFISNHLHREKR